MLAGEGASAPRRSPSARKLVAPRPVWIMVPAGKTTEATITEVAAVLEPGDAIIGGGNSHYRDDIRHSKMPS